MGPQQPQLPQLPQLPLPQPQPQQQLQPQLLPPPQLQRIALTPALTHPSPSLAPVPASLFPRGQPPKPTLSTSVWRLARCWPPSTTRPSTTTSPLSSAATTPGSA